MPKAMVVSMAAMMLVAVWAGAQDEPPPAPRIPPDRIAALEAEARQLGTAGTSRTEQRRNCKNVARLGMALVDEYPTSPDRFRVLKIVFECQKILVGLDGSELNRKALFDTCGKLAEAPDEYAESRLEADALLSDGALTARNATPEERAQALEALILRYRGTPAEAKSLMMAALIAQQLDALELQKTIIEVMDERFADDPVMVAFRRDNLSLGALILKCGGKYTRADGVTLYLPDDRIGHQSMMVFWSKASPGVEAYLAQIKAHEETYPGIFDVFSFNLDELPDAGQQELQRMGLTWTPMRLPGGKGSDVYRAYAKKDPIALVINAYGYTVLPPTFAASDASVGVRKLYSPEFKIDDSRVSSERYLAQLQALFIGDFLILDTEHAFDPATPPELRMVAMGEAGEPEAQLTRTAESVPAEQLKSIQDCFVAPPFRYRLKQDEAVERYSKAEKLCADTLHRFPGAPDIWMVHNRRIVALLGLWNLVGEPKYLDQAAAEAGATLKMELPRGADVVARFCLARNALRCERPDPAAVLRGFVEACGGDRAPASAMAAAAMLSLAGNSRELHEQYRAILLNAPGDGNPLLWSVRSFLCDRYHQFYLLRPNFTRGDAMGFPRSHIVNSSGCSDFKRLPKMELTALDGSSMNVPGGDKLTLLLFIEPPADPAADFPVVLDRRGNPTANDSIRVTMEHAAMLCRTHVNGAVDLVAAFLCDDPVRVKSLMEKNKWTCRAAVVPGGLKNPAVRRLGILSADRVPNVILARRDGSIEWHASGLEYKSEFGFPFAFLLAMKVHIEICEAEAGYRALQDGDYAQAARLFTGPFLPAEPDRYGWRTPQYHGRAVARMGLKDWAGALEDIDAAIDSHKLEHNPHKRGKRIQDWRKDAKGVVSLNPCDVFAEMLATKTIILEKMGRNEEAAALRKKVSAPTEIHQSVYGAFQNRLKEFRAAHF